MDIKNKKIGSIEISLDLIENNLETVSKLFSKMEFVALRAECHIYINSIKYVGISRMFREIKEGEEIPEYRTMITQGEGGRIAYIEVEEDNK
ncbi:MAG: hypothetical protein JRJ00_00190 [Deltaproteobacteria bacterium]|nr:hypothetical protein [Deltaproteobacteria bacterium]